MNTALTRYHHYLFVLALAGFSSSALAQPTLTSSTNGLSGSLGKETIFGVYNTQVSEGASGASQTWNFGTLKSSSGTSLFYQNCVALACDSFTGSTFYSIDLTQYGVYMNTTATATTVYGAGSLGLKSHYSDPEDIMHFPFSFGSSYVDSFRLINAYGGTTQGYDKGSDSTTADAWGTITTPLATYPNALRIKQVRTYVDSLLTGSVTYIKSTNYYWYVTTRTDYVFHTGTSVTSGTSANTSSSATWMGQASAVPEIAKASAIRLSPNPVNNALNVTITAAGAVSAHLLVTDMIGRELCRADQQLKAGTNTVLLNVSILPAGLYFMAFSTGDSRVLQRFEKR